MGLKNEIKKFVEKEGAAGLATRLHSYVGPMKKAVEEISFITEQATENKMRLGVFLRQLREEKKLSLRDVEKLTGISNPFLSQIERGIRGTQNLALLSKLAAAYDTPLPRFIERYGGALKNQIDKEGEEIQLLVERYKSLPKQDQHMFSEWLKFKTEESNRSRSRKSQPKTSKISGK
jgi:transcriptional regulator with XRE-family HTH domain